MITLKQLRSVIAVVEEGSFTRAAQREHATQSGVSQHVAAAEAALGVQLFERLPDGVRPTLAGRRYYDHAIAALRELGEAASNAQAARDSVSGTVRAGLMPAFTRAALAPVLDVFLTRHPEVDVQIIEGYSGTLTEMVRARTLDFALVPSGPSEVGLSVSHLVRDREMLVSGPDLGLVHSRPVVLAHLEPLHLIVPSAGNVRRPKLEEYLATHGVKIAQLLEMDAMMGTLELIALGTWVSILPNLICVNDASGGCRHVSPISGPTLHSDFVVIEPARHPLTTQAKLLLEALRHEINRLATP